MGHRDLHHEPVALRLGQLVHAFRFDRVLSGDHEERSGHVIGVASDGDMLFGHHFEQRRLHLRRGPVDLVGQQEVDEHGAELDIELLARRAEDPRADDVGRQKVGRELHTPEGATDHLRQRLGGQRLGQTGHALQKAMSLAEQADEHSLDQPALADDHLAQLEENPFDDQRRRLVVLRQIGRDGHSDSAPSGPNGSNALRFFGRAFSASSAIHTRFSAESHRLAWASRTVATQLVIRRAVGRWRYSFGPCALVPGPNTPVMTNCAPGNISPSMPMKGIEPPSPNARESLPKLAVDASSSAFCNHGANDGAFQPGPEWTLSNVTWAPYGGSLVSAVRSASDAASWSHVGGTRMLR